MFCQSAIESAQKDHATVVQNMIDNKESHLDKLRTLFSHLLARVRDVVMSFDINQSVTRHRGRSYGHLGKLGADRTGGITLRMFEEKINSPSVREYFDPWLLFSFEPELPVGFLVPNSIQLCFTHILCRI